MTGQTRVLVNGTCVTGLTGRSMMVQKVLTERGKMGSNKWG